MPFRVLHDKLRTPAIFHILFKLGLMAWLTFLITACSDTDSEPAPETASFLVQGNAVKGVIAHGLVRIYYESSDGTEVDIGHTRTDEHGNFALNLPEVGDDPVILVEISADAETLMRCDRTMGCESAQGMFEFADEMPLPSHFRLMGVVDTVSGHAYVSPLSHLIVQSARQASAPLTQAALKRASAQVMRSFELEQNPLQTRTPDLTALSQDAHLTSGQLKQAIVSASLFHQSLSPAWSHEFVALTSLEMAQVVLDTSLISAELSNQAKVTQSAYALVFGQIQKNTTKHYRALSRTTGRAPSSSINQNLTDSGQETAGEFRRTAVIGYPESLTITEHPEDQVVMPGSSVTFSVTVSGTGPFTYQWRLNGSTPIAGANGPTLTIPITSLAYNYSYFDVLVSNASNPRGVRSSMARLYINSAMPLPAFIETQPAAQSLDVGQTLLLRVRASGDTPIYYQWLKNNIPIDGATSSRFSIPSVTLADAGSYSVHVYNHGNTLPARSQRASVTVRASSVPPPITDGTWYRPAVGVDWHWQQDGTLNTAHAVEIYDIDLFDTSADTISGLQSQGKKVICYFSAGSYEEWREDAGDFAEGDLGSKLDGWDERWLDIRSSTVRTVMLARLDLAQSKGCDGVEPDNVDGYANTSGFALTAADQLEYNTFLANAAHERSLAVALKNDLDQVEALVDYFDFAVNEECDYYDECDALAPFIAQGKPVLHVEYHSDYVTSDSVFSDLCADVAARSFSTLVLPLDLDDSFRKSCGGQGDQDTADLPLSITDHPDSQVSPPGGSATFSVAVSGTGPFTYQWRRNGSTLIPGANGPSLTLSNLTLADNNAYFDVLVSSATNPNGIRSTSARLKINTSTLPAQIVSQPTAQTLAAGQSLRLQVSATGDAPIHYQWLKNNTPIVGATSASFSKDQVTSEDAGSYSVQVHNAGNSTPLRSNAAQVAVVSVQSPLVITTQPEDQVVIPGGTVTFSVGVSGTGPFTYQWRLNGSTPIAGANGPTLTMPNISQAYNYAYFDVVVSNASNPRGVSSKMARLYISSAMPLPAFIETQPTPQNLTVGQPLLLRVRASGDTPIFYQWLKNNTPIAGATSASFNIESVSLADAGSYAVQVSNQGNSVPARSQSVTVSVSDPNAQIAITQQPRDAVVASGGSATFSVSASGAPNLTYQWYRSSCNPQVGNLIANATRNTLTLSDVDTSDAGTYCARIASGSLPVVTSNLARLSVLADGSPPVSILTQPVGQTVISGEPITLSVVASGTNLSYQWFKDNNPYPVFSGGSVFRIASASPEHAGNYRVTVRNADGSSTATSNSAMVQVQEANSVLLSWSRPTTRVDRSALDADEIHGYVLQYGFSANSYSREVRVTGAETLSHELQSLPDGVVYLRIATIDSHRQQGPFSSPIAVSIP